jgi:hypothetical protein
VKTMPTPDPGDDGNWATRIFREGCIKFREGCIKGGNPYTVFAVSKAPERNGGPPSYGWMREDRLRAIEEIWATTRWARRVSPTAKPSEERSSLPGWFVLVTKIFLSLGYLARSVRLWLSAGSLTWLAVLLAGHKRSAMADEWRAHLAGWPGAELSRRDQVRAARGFIWAAVRYRLEDAADLAWWPADAVLGSRLLSNLFVWGPVIVMLVAIVHHDGRFGLVADIQDPAALGAFLYGVIRTGRWWRGVKPPEPKARRARSGGGNG